MLPPSIPALECATRLETFIKARGIKPAALARESGYSRQHLLRIRMGRMEPTRRCMAAIVGATRRLTRSTIDVADLFDFDDGPRDTRASALAGLRS